MVLPNTKGDMMKIGKVLINNPVIVAPMAGVTDYPYRQILREMGCELVYTEMVSSKGLIYGSEKTVNLVEFDRKGGKIAVQLFGEEPEIMAKAAKMVETRFKPDIVDINMGCPTPKIIKNGSGSALMKEPDLAGDIIEAVVNAVDVPVTVKIRKGWDKDNINAVQIAKIAEEKGASALAIHGRTREDFYRGNADWGIIKKVKENIKIPVIGNGDIFEPEDAKSMIELTDCDGVMVARGIQGNPWLIKRITFYLKNGTLLPEPDYKEKIEMALYHLYKSISYYGEKIGIPKMRKHIAWYIKGMPYSTTIKEKVNKLNKYKEIENILKEYLNQLL